MESFVVNNPKGTPAERYKWLWEQQRNEFVMLQQRQDALLLELHQVQADSKAAHHQLDMAKRERDVYAGALLQAHKAAAAWEAVFASIRPAAKNANQ